MEVRIMIHKASTLCVLLIAISLAACSGAGGGMNTTPALQHAAQQPATVPGAAVQVSANVLQSAPAGVRVYVHLPLRNSAQLDELIREQSTQGSAFYHQWLTPEQFREKYGPTAQNLNAAATYLQSQGFRTTMTSQGIVADAPQATVEHTFGIQLSTRSVPMSLSHTGPSVSLMTANRAPTIPSRLSALGAHVAAYAAVPAMQPELSLISNKIIAPPQNRYQPWGFYWFDDLKQAYRYPAYQVEHGQGRTIAIISVSNYDPSDMSVYFGHEGVTPPNVIVRSVDGGPQPFGGVGDGYSDEVSLDLQQAGGSAPGATLVIYGVPDASLEPSFLDAYTAIVEDDAADVVASSYGVGCEQAFIAAYNGGFDFTYYFQDFHDIFRQGNAEGITFLNASGDNGALGCAPYGGTGSGAFGVLFPANDPDVTGVGGTNLETTDDYPSSLNSAYIAENADDDPLDPSLSGYTGVWGSGGGASVYWQKPFFQFLANTGSSMRTVPDISMHMGGCPSDAQQPCSPDRSADLVSIGGVCCYGFIGTSASVQEFAGLQALQDETLHSRVGNVNFLLYALRGFGDYRTNIPGNNGYATHPGYNWVLGNGTPYAAKYAFDPFGPFAGIPQTPSNP
jgi:subtilase family serine protease